MTSFELVLPEGSLSKRGKLYSPLSKVCGIDLTSVGRVWEHGELASHRAAAHHLGPEAFCSCNSSRRESYLLLDKHRANSR